MKIFYLLTFVLFSVFTSTASSFEDIHNHRFKEVLPPTATITASATTVCQSSGNVTITFTGSGGTAPYTFIYKLNAGTNQTISSIGASSVITLNLSSDTVGAFNYQMVSVTSAGVTETENSNVVVTVSQPITANFIFNTTAQCSGTSILFDSTVSGGSGNYSYSWDFGDGFTSTIADPSHIFTSLGCGNQTFTVVLTVTSGGCTKTVSYPVVVKNKPNLVIEDADIFFPFSNCHNNPSASNSSYTLVLNNVSPSLSCILSYDINWGDNSTVIGATFPASHTYTQLGAFQLTVTAHGQNGCTSVKTYPVANQSNPAGGLGTLGATTGLCAPAVVPFTISNWELNSPGTTYLINFGDGTSITLDHPLLSSTIYHTYTTSSCPEPTFTATLKVINLCDTTPYSAGNIQIRIKPEASFTGPLISCVGQNVCFMSNSILGSNGNNCTPLTVYTWNFGDPAGIANVITGNGLTIPNGCHSYSVPGTYTVSLTLSNPCGPTTYTRQICIEAPLSPQFTLSQSNGCSPLNVTTSNTTNLSNSCGTPTYLWNVNYAVGNCGSGTPASFYAAGSTSASANPSFQFITPGTYSISLTTTNSCGSITSTIQSVIVKKPPTASIATISNYCGTATINPTATITTCAPTGEVMTYAWTFAGGSPATSSSANPGSITYSSAGNYTVSLIVTNSCGASTISSQTFTVNVAPTITNTSLSQTICSGQQTSAVTLTASPAGATFAWTAIATAGVAGFTTSGTSAIIPSQTLTNTSAAAGTVTYTITPTLGTCAGLVATYIVTVNPTPSIVTHPANATVCQNAVMNPLNVAFIKGTGLPNYQWYSNISNSNTGGLLIPSATSQTFIPPSTTVGTMYYYVVISFPTSGCANLISNTAAISINPPISIATQPLASQSICVGGSSSILSVSYNGGTGTPTYQWYSNTTATNSGGTIITGQTTANYTPTGFSVPGTYHYYAVIMTANGCGQAASTVATITVVADPTVTLTPPSQIICAGVTADAIIATATGGNGAYSYQWYLNTTPSNVGGSIIATATNATYTPPPSTPGTKYYYVIVKQTTSSGCEIVSSTVSIQTILAATISSQPTSSTVCVGGNPTLLSVSYINGVGTPAYQWYSNNTNSTVGGTPISGATSTTYQPTASSIGTIYYYVIITLPSGGCSSLTSTIATVNVVETAVITTQPTADQTICVGGSILPLTVAYSGATGTPSYQWYKNTTASNSGGTLIPGATLATYTPTPFNTVGVFHFYATITISGTGCGAISSTIATVNVVADPTVTLSPLTQTLCAGANAAPITASAAGGTGSFLYQWFSNTANNTTSGTPITGETNSTYTPSTTTVGTQYFYVVVSTEISGCSATSATSSVTVIASPTFTQQPAANTVCQGGTLSPLSVTYINGTGIPTYQWYSNSDNNTASGTAISGATNPTYIPSAADIGTQFYYVIITLPASAGCSSITSDTAEITITAGTTIVTQPIPSQSLCIGGSLPNNLEVEFGGGTGIPSYQWFNNTTAANSGGTAITGATTSTYSPPTYLVAGTYYYYAVVSLSGNGCGAVASAVAQVIVLPDPIVTSQPIISQTLCQSATPAPLSVTASGGVGTFSYQWYSNTTNSTVGGQLISGANLASFIPYTDVVGTLYYYVIISQSGAGCEVTSATSQVTINLAPSINQQPISETVCIGATLSTLSISYINGTGTPSYQWYSNTVDNTSTGIAISGANGSSFTPSSSTVGTVYYYAVVTLPSSGGCSAIISQTASITVNSLPTISLQPATTQSICIDGNIPAPLSVNYQGGHGVASYQWFSNTQSSNTGGTIIPGATGPNYTPPTFTSSGNYYYYAVVTLSGNGCGNVASETATVIVVNDPVVTAQPLPFQEICQNSVPSILTVNVSGGVGTLYNYQWYINTANNNSGGNPISGATAQNYSPETNLIGTYYYYVMISQAPGAGCSTVSATSTIVINSAPIIQNQPSSSVICLGQAVVLGVSYINGAGIPQYQWYSNTVNSTLGATPILGETLSNYTPSTATAGTMYYYAIISLPGGCGDLISDIVFVTVNANPVIASTSQVICSGNSFTVNPDNTGGNVVPVGTTYTWSMPTINPPGSITGATAQGSQQPQISQTLINSTISPSTVTYTVTPIWETCLGEDFTITVTVNPSISPNVTFANSTCYAASNGNIQTNITGGIPFPITPYQVSWTGPSGFTSSAPSIFNLAPGTYDLTINDAGGCPFTATYIITEPDEIIISTDSENNITCFGDADGAISISVTGGTLPYQYTWTKNNLPFSTIEDIANLGPGNYTISVTDANGCGPATANFTIMEPPLLTVTLGNQTNILCYSAATGAISVNVGGGTPIEISAGIFSYTFFWSGPNGFTSTEKDLTELSAGTYNLTVTDQNGCSKSLTVILTQNTEIIITAITTPITCYGANNASISLTVSGGVGPYQAAWDNLATGLFQDNLGPGTYIILITDALFCQKPITVVIPDVPVFMVNPIVQQISCFGANDGSINLNLTGGIAPVTMIWTDGSTAGLIRNNLGPGTYIATISDGTPCHITRTFILVEPQPLVLTATTVNAFVCDNANSGSINLTVGGGTAPYTYSWTNGASTEDLINITSGTFSVTVTDARGCIKTAQFTITRPSPIVIVMNVETVADCSTGSVKQIFTAQVSGGVAPFVNAWSSGTISGTNNQTMTTSQNTTVVFSTTDSLGCTASYTFDVDVPIINDADFSTTSIGYETYGLYSIIDPIQFTNGAQGNWTSISWDFGDGSFSTEENPIHSYIAEGPYVVTQTVTYPFGCVYKHIITLIVKKGYFLEVPSAFTPNGDSLNDTFRPVSKGMQNVQLSVYDTWGSLIYFEQGTILRGWDGTIKGRPAENGNYYCKVSAETFYRTTVNVSHPFVLIN